MPPHNYIPARRRTSTRRISRDTNALGYDPDGRATHLSQHLFGPWLPYIAPQVRFVGKYCASPRYGPPSIDQIPWLPPGFISQNPPSYYGSPSPPYLAPPLDFDPDLFAEFISRPSMHKLDGAKLVGEDAPVEQVEAGGTCLDIQFELPHDLGVSLSF